MKCWQLLERKVKGKAKELNKEGTMIKASIASTMLKKDFKD